jgi:general secretion pathway protein M
VVAIGILLGALLTAWNIFFAPVLASLSAARRDLAALERQDQHARLEAAALPSLQLELERLQASHALDGVFLQGNDPTLLASELQRKSNSIILAAGATLLGSLTSPVEREAGHLRVGLQVDLTATMDALHATLYRLETESPLLMVDHLDIEASENASAQTVTDGPPVYAVHLHVSAYARSSS